MNTTSNSDCCGGCGDTDGNKRCIGCMHPFTTATTPAYSPTALDFNPFEGDFGIPGDKVFSDKMVVGRKQYQCSHCNGPVIAGERHRYQASKFDGELMTYRWCAECCVAMVTQMQAENNDDESIDQNDLAPQFDQWERRSKLHLNAIAKNSTP